MVSADYDGQTRRAYQSAARAAAYQRRQAGGWTWARVVTWREQQIVRRLLRALVPAGEYILDCPCGTGVLGPTLAGLPLKVVAADISGEMMALARGRYDASDLLGFVRADVLSPPFVPGRFAAAVCLGFMHRVPDEIGRGALESLGHAAAGPLVVTFSVDGPLQRIKRRLVALVNRDYAAAPHSRRLADIARECRTLGFAVRAVRRPVPLLSSDLVLVLEREPRG